MTHNLLEQLDLTPIKSAVKKTTIIRASKLDGRLNLPLIIASETFQETGSFKFRAAYCAAFYSKCDHLLTASSGNFGQALARAAQILGKQCTVVMPSTSAAVKVEAVKGFGATVELVDTTKVSRKQKVDEIALLLKALGKEVDVLSAYDSNRVIAGNSTLGEELAQVHDELDSSDKFDCVIVPMGGGGLLSGIVTGLRRKGVNLPVHAAEPALANDGARSIAQGKIVSNDVEPATIADGARTISLGERNFAVLKDALAGVIEVSEANIEEGLRLLYGLANLKVEPTGALSLGAILQEPQKFAGQRPLIVVSGGNVDASVYARLI